MKTVHTSDMVAHLWAHQSQPSARNAGRSFSFDGPTLYSYGTPIARLHDTAAGRVALVSSNGYSVTTKTKHLSPMHRALIGMVAHSFSVPYVGAFGGRAPSRAQKPAEWHAVNVAHLIEEYSELCGRMRRAQTLYISSRDEMCERLQDAARIVTNYCAAFGLAAPSPAIDTADDARVIWRARELREEKRNDPAAVAKRERANARREELKREKAERERAARFEREAEYRARFRSGASGYFGHVSDEHGGALLRYDASDDTVRTSYGAEVAAAHCRRVFPLIERARATGTEWRPNGHTEHLGPFALNEIRADGSVRVGCHTVYWPEVEACARALGLSV